MYQDMQVHKKSCIIVVSTLKYTKILESFSNHIFNKYVFFRWLVNGIVVDDQYEHNAGDVIENRLLWSAISRKDLDALFTCQAINTKLTDPKESVVVLDLICEY